MKRILLVKLTSLGDLIHALPALTDASTAHPDLGVDWVIDENFQEVASWHPAIDRIITTNHRHWRMSPLAAIKPIRDLAKAMRETHYDLIIDGQGNFKSAALATLAKGPRAGYDKHSLREPIAHLAYHRKYRASLTAHAIDRLRQLFGAALDYPVPSTAPNFSIQQDRFVRPSIELPSSYLVFVTNAGWKTKLWPEHHWKYLLEKTTESDYTVLLPWGNAEEELRTRRLSQDLPQIKVLPRLPLSQIGYIIARAKACVCVDTGLSHLAAALGIPSLTLYGATDAGKIGSCGKNQFHLKSTLSCSPCNKKVCPISSVGPPCLAQISPEMVFQRLVQILTSTQFSSTCSTPCESYIAR